MATITSPSDLLKLIPNELKYDPARGIAGLEVTSERGKLWIQNRNAAGIPVNFSRAQSEWLAENLPKHLPATTLGRLFGFTETLRRKQGLAAHIRAAVQQRLGEDAVQWESLDPKNPNAKLMTAQELAKASPDELPRAYTYVKAKPEPPTRFIFFREFAFILKSQGGKIRPDELIISYPITEKELDLVLGGKRFTEILLQPETRKIASLHIHSGDINRPLSGDSLVKHFEKTMSGAIAGLEHLTENLKIEPQGSVTVTAKDSYLTAQKVRIKGNRAAVVRHLPTDTERKVSLSFRASLVRNREGVWNSGGPNLKLRRVAQELVQNQLGLRALQVAGNLERLLQRVARMAR